MSKTKRQEAIDAAINDATQELVKGYESFLTYRPGEDGEEDCARGMMMKNILKSLGDKIRATKEINE